MLPIELHLKPCLLKHLSRCNCSLSPTLSCILQHGDDIVDMQHLARASRFVLFSRKVRMQVPFLQFEMRVLCKCYQEFVCTVYQQFLCTF